MKGKRKNWNKKLVSLILIFSMLLGVSPVSAEEQIKPVELTLGNLTAKAGDTIEIVLDISENSEIGSLECNLEYDKSKMSIIKYTMGKALVNHFMETGSVMFEPNGDKIGFITNERLKHGGEFAKITFKVNESLSGKEEIKITKAYLKQYNEKNEDLHDVIPTINNGSITVLTPLTGISLNKTETNILVGETETLEVSYEPSTTTDDKTATWESSDESIATVKDGVVTAVKPGKATITATVGQFSAECQVTVPNRLTEISLNKTELELVKGLREKLVVNYVPVGADDIVSTAWESSNEQVATVNPNNGEILAIGGGTAEIKAVVMASGKEYSAVCHLTVTVPLTGISLDKTSGTLIVGGEGTDQLTVNYTPNDTTEVKTVKWTSDNDRIATVDENGLVTGISGGTAIITATVGKFSATYKAEVKVPLTKIAFSKTAGTLLKGKTDQLAITYDPENTTDDKTPVWSSTNDAVVKVDQNGLVTAVGEGKASIKAKVGTLEAVCEYMITEIHIAEVKLDKETVEIQKGKSKVLVASILPMDTTDDQTIEWTTSNDKVATVDQSGKVTVIEKEGTAIITATSKVDKTKKATCTVKAMPIPLDSISIEPKAVDLMVGDEKQMTVTYNPEDTTVTKNVEWSSSDENVATVDKDGKVKAIALGTATVTGKVDGKTATSGITVSEHLKRIELEKEEIILEKGVNKTLQVSYFPENPISKGELSWVSDNEKVATVDSETGVITAVSGGNANIKATVKVEDKLFTASCKVNVKVTLESISLDKTEGTLIIGGKNTEELNVLYNPEDTTDDKTVTWRSSNDQIATVKDGVVTGISGGSAIITATVGTKTATYNANVEVPLTGISLNKSKGTLTIGGTSTDQLSVIYTPENTTDDKTVTWESSDSSVATVSESGLVTAISGGKANITGTVGEFTGTYEVTVVVPLTSIALNKITGTLLKGQSDLLTVSYDPENTTEDKTITWISSDEKIARVDQSGKVNAIKEGNVKITAKVGTYEASCDYTIEEIHISEITLNKEKTEIKKGSTEKLIATILPANTTDDKTILWTSSDEKVATVDENGVVTAKAIEGTAVITGTSKVHNNIKGSCTVTALPISLESITITPEKMTLIEGESRALAVAFKPIDTTDDKTILWKSSDEKVATVDSKGNVKGIAQGKARITAEVGKKIASCEVEIQKSGLVSVTGQVKDSSGKPMVNAKIRLQSEPRYTVTDTNGYFTFTDVPLGHHILSVMDDNGNVIASKEVYIIKGTQTQFNNATGEIVLKDGVSAITLSLVINGKGGLEIEKISEGNLTPPEPTKPTDPEKDGKGTQNKTSGTNPKTGSEVAAYAILSIITASLGIFVTVWFINKKLRA